MPRLPSRTIVNSRNSFAFMGVVFALLAFGVVSWNPSSAKSKGSLAQTSTRKGFTAAVDESSVTYPATESNISRVSSVQTVSRETSSALRDMDAVAVSRTRNFHEVIAGSNPGEMIEISGVSPVDGDREIGDTQTVKVKGTGFEVIDNESGTPLFGPADVSMLWAGLGGDCETGASGNAGVLFDKDAGRWVFFRLASATGKRPANEMCFAISTTNDAAGSYYRYGFKMGVNFREDPFVRVGQEGYDVIGGAYDESGIHRQGSHVFVLDRASMLYGKEAVLNDRGVQADKVGVHKNSPTAGLTVTPTFDASITGDAVNGATIQAAVNKVIAAYQNTFSNSVTVNITFQEVNTGLGASSTFGCNVAYSTYRTKLTSAATTIDDATALGNVPASSPISGTADDTQIRVPTALSNALSLGCGAAATDSTISLKTSIMNLARAGTQNAASYDIYAVTAHEVDEAISLGSGLDNLTNGNGISGVRIKPADLHRFSAAGTRSFDSNLGTNAYFSIDGGTTNLVRFNQDDGGDFGDWFSTAAHTPQVQDAFGTPGTYPNLGVELRRLDVIGYTRNSPAPLTFTSPGTQSAPALSSGTFNLGSVNSGNGPFGITVDWGDSSSITSFFVTSTGSLGSQNHTYAAPGAYTVTVSGTDFTSQTGSFTFTANATATAPTSTAAANQNASEGASTSFALGTFVDPDGGPWTIDVNWGDSTAHSSPSYTGPVAGVYTINNTGHTYAEEGLYTVTVKVTDSTNLSVSKTFQVTVADQQLNNLASANLPLSGQEAVSIGAITGIATFTDPAGAEPVSDYTATINWGDASSSAGTIVSLGAGNFRVDAPAHIYGEEGAYTVFTTLKHDALATVNTPNQQIIIADQQINNLASANLPTNGLEGASIGAIIGIATFTDPAGAEPVADYVATINWGDLGSSAGTIVSTGGGNFRVDAPAHTYVEEGTYIVNTTIKHDALVAVNTPNQSIVIADQQITTLASANLPASGFEGASIGAITGIATFFDPAGAEPVSDYVATVNWGDASSSAGTVVSTGGGNFRVDAPAHTYVEEGTYIVNTTLKHDALAPLTTPNQTIVVADPQLTNLASANLPATVLEAVSTGAITGIATFTDPGGPEPDGVAAYVATINWGDGFTSPGTVVYVSGNNFRVDAPAHTYGEEGSYVVNTTLKHDLLPALTTPNQTINVLEQQITNLTGGGLTQTVTLTASTLPASGLATFTDPAGAEPSPSDPLGIPDSHYATLIHWGDNTTSPGSVVITGPTTLRVDMPAHTYAAVGVYTVTVDVKHESAATLTVTGATITVNVTIAGNIKLAPAGTNLGGVSVALTGANSAGLTPTTTDANGNYSFTGIFNGAFYTVTPTLSGFGLDPISRTIATPAANVTNVDFLAYVGQVPRALTVPTSFATPGQSAVVAVNMSSLGNEKKVIFTVSYDVNLLSTPTAACGTSDAGCSIVQTNTPGTIGLAVTFANAMNNGPRNIANITFQTFANEPASTPIGISNPSATDVSAIPNPLFISATGGLVIFAQGVEGDVWDKTANGGAGGPGRDGKVTAEDAIREAVLVSNTALVNTTTSNEYQRADTADSGNKGNGVINAADVVQSVNYFAGLNGGNQVSVGGPFQPLPGPPPLNRAGKEERSIRIASSTADRGGNATVAVEIDPKGDEVASSFSLKFDPTKLSIDHTNGVQNPDIAIGTGAPDGTTVVVNIDESESGKLGFVVFNASMIPFAKGEAAKQMITVRFHVAKDAQPGQTAIAFDEAGPAPLSNSDALAQDLTANYIDGNLTITGQVASGVEVSGRVLTPDGRGLRNAKVTITDETGQTRMAATSSFGYYRFEGLTAGSIYTVAVSSRTLRFETRRILTSDSLADVDFIGQE